MSGDVGFLTDTFEEIAETGVAHCRLCPEGDDEIDVDGVSGFGEVLDMMADHGIEEHGLPEDKPWTNDMLDAAMEE